MGNSHLCLPGDIFIPILYRFMLLIIYNIHTDIPGRLDLIIEFNLFAPLPNFNPNFINTLRWIHSFNYRNNMVVVNKMDDLLEYCFSINLLGCRPRYLRYSKDS